MTDAKIERVARAICKHECILEYSDDPCAEGECALWRDWRSIAQVAYEAAALPSPAPPADHAELLTALDDVSTGVFISSKYQKQAKAAILSLLDQLAKVMAERDEAIAERGAWQHASGAEGADNARLQNRADTLAAENARLLDMVAGSLALMKLADARGDIGDVLLHIDFLTKDIAALKATRA
jgi:hypothetical protein